MGKKKKGKKSSDTSDVQSAVNGSTSASKPEKKILEASVENKSKTGQKTPSDSASLNTKENQPSTTNSSLNASNSSAQSSSASSSKTVDKIVKRLDEQSKLAAKGVKDKRLIPRIKEYLDQRTNKNFVSIPLMAEYLQKKYPEYGRKKKGAFVHYVDKAYFSLEKKGDKSAVKDEMGGYVSVDSSDESEEEKLVEYKDTNSMNSMMSNMYKSSPNHSSGEHSGKKRKLDSTPGTVKRSKSAEEDEPFQEKIIYPSPNILSRNSSTTGLVGPRRSAADKYFIDRKGDNQNETTNHEPQKKSREENIEEFLGSLPSRTSYSVYLNKHQDPRLKGSSLYRVYNPSAREDSHMTHSGITEDNIGVSERNPRSPSPHSVVDVDTDMRDDAQGHDSDRKSEGDKKREQSRPKTPRKNKTKSKRQDENDLDTQSEKGPLIQKSSVTFADVGGNDATLTEICKLLVHMRHPEVYEQLGITPPRGFLLHGPPGCGKTLLANAIAGELDLPLLKIAATEIVSGVSGDSEEKVRNLFQKAMQSAPCIVFIDEIDSITPKRETASKDMERRIVAQLLACMDDLNAISSVHVLVIGATNRPDSLDPALRRAGRFDREICLGIPDEIARLKILEVLCRPLRLTPGFDYSYIAKNTPGYVGADLMALTREAAMTAVNRAFQDFQSSAVPGSSEMDQSAVMVTATSIQISDVVSCDNSTLLFTNNQSADCENKTKTDNIQSADSENKTKTDNNQSADSENKTKTDNNQSADSENKTKTDNNQAVESEIKTEKSDSANSGTVVMDNTENVGVTSTCAGPVETVADKAAGVSLENIKTDNSIADSDTPCGCPDKGESAMDTGTGDGDDGSTGRKKNDQPKSELSSVLTWLKDQPPLTQEQLRDLFISMEDFKEALKYVQPSAKREGFATIPDVTWDDIGALHDVREELQLAILAPVHHAEDFKSLGLNHAQGILLAGPPGCGKTLLAKAIANESGINFISVKGPELLNMYVGESERAVRTVFQRARNSSPCVIFFDELDALCPRRSGNAEGGSSARVVNQLLTEMDGLEERKQVFIMAATNRPDIIDPAILRPGRLDKTLYVGLPTEADRRDIFTCITKNGTQPRLAGDVDLNMLAEDSRCDGMTGADLAALVREASISALKEAIVQKDRKSSDAISVRKDHFETAFRKTKPSVSVKDQEKYKNMRGKQTLDL